MTARWTSDDMPGQDGRLAVVTGANTGLGFETARVLAARCVGCIGRAPALADHECLSATVIVR